MCVVLCVEDKETKETTNLGGWKRRVFREKGEVESANTSPFIGERKGYCFSCGLSKPQREKMHTYGGGKGGGAFFAYLNNLHDKVDVVVGLQDLLQLHDVRVAAEALHNAYLSVEQLLSGRVLQELLCDV